MVGHPSNTSGVSPNPGSRPQADNGKSSVLRLPFSRPPCVPLRLRNHGAMTRVKCVHRQKKSASPTRTALHGGQHGYVMGPLLDCLEDHKWAEQLGGILDKDTP